MIAVDKEYALILTDLDKPIVVVRIISKGEDVSCLMIDGWHRVYRARLEGRTSLPAHLLSAKAERTVQIALY